MDLGGNQFKVLPDELPDLPKLGRLVIKDNAIAKFDELLKVGAWAKLRDIDCSGNPVEEEVANVKQEFLIKMPDQWNKINEEVITQEERQEAEAEKEQRIKDEEAKRLEEEEAARQKEAEEGGEEEAEG